MTISSRDCTRRHRVGKPGVSCGVLAPYRVKGVLFLDYVRMLRALKGVDWSELLPAEDLPYLQTRIEPDAWYPMGAFERMGNQILRLVARNDLALVRMWGRAQVEPLKDAEPDLVSPGDPMETINRFRVLRSTYFDFEALEVLMLHEDEALIAIRYHMGMPAEEAASWQTLGFFEQLLELSGASNVKALFTERSWYGDPRTVLALAWRMPSGDGQGAAR
ncbi:MAG TPA: hypothetical protein VK698_23135 [Kofleriaceae bacterium]|nr:hypothetical protein [Kofleriaceae bacterium]